MIELSYFERWWLNSWPHRLHIQRYVPKLLKSSPAPIVGEVLEVGAGSGWSSRRVLETFPQVELTAIDVDPRAAKSFAKLKEKYGRRLKFSEADVMHLPHDRASFDFVLAIHVLHQVEHLPQALRELIRVLRPGGLIGIADENQHLVVGPLRWLWPALHRINAKELTETLEAEGAEIVSSVGTVHFSIWARKPYT